jgi:hypothetical protein
VNRLLALLSLGGAWLALAAAPAGAANECRGLMVCVPVAGPWVLVPPGKGGVFRQPVEYQLRCPRGYIVGGLDAELSDRSIDLAFLGTVGSPVTPGITTSREVVFVGTYTGVRARMTSFRPHIGCIPTSGGGGRGMTARNAFPPARPTVRRVRTLRPAPQRTQRIVHACAPGERLIAASHAVGFHTAAPPDERLAASAQVEQAVHTGQIRVAVRGGPALRGIRGEVQVHAVCAGGRP